MFVQRYDDDDDEYDFEDVDCQDCGMKFFIRPSRYNKDGKDYKGNPPPVKCERCLKGLPPLYEF